MDRDAPAVELQEELRAWSSASIMATVAQQRARAMDKFARSWVHRPLLALPLLPMIAPFRKSKRSEDESPELNDDTQSRQPHTTHRRPGQRAVYL